MPVQQWHTKLAFQCLDVHRYIRLHRVQRLSRARYAAQLRDRRKNPKLRRFHISPLNRLMFCHHKS
jgi:hypothetical protein